MSLYHPGSVYVCTVGKEGGRTLELWLSRRGALISTRYFSLIEYDLEFVRALPGVEIVEHEKETILIRLEGIKRYLVKDYYVNVEAQDRLIALAPHFVAWAEARRD